MSLKNREMSSPIYQLKITLRGGKPPIWRRVLVPGAFSLYQLHQLIQAAMGWRNCHFHGFTIDGERYALPSPDDWEPVVDERSHSVGQIAPRVKQKFVYEYDFGDGWEHEIVVEKILAPETGVKYPFCVTGRRACPPEDVGGPWGYAEFLVAISDRNHEEHESFLEWCGGSFDAAAFDLDAVNRQLRRVKV